MDNFAKSKFSALFLMINYRCKIKHIFLKKSSMVNVLTWVNSQIPVKITRIMLWLSVVTHQCNWGLFIAAGCLGVQVLVL